MDEVKAMARAGEQVGRVVGTGVRSARRGAVCAGRAGATMSRQAADRARQELASRDISPEEWQELLLQKTVGLSRKALRKRRKQLRKEWVKNAKAARQGLVARIAPEPARKHRKWPWMLLAIAGLGLAAALLLSRRPEELPVAEAEEPGAPYDQ